MKQRELNTLVILVLKNMSTLRERDVYQQELAKLEFVYPSSVIHKMVTSSMKGLSTFDIEYKSTSTEHKNERKPLGDYEDQFGPQESGRHCSKCGIGVPCQGHYGVVKFPIDPVTAKRIMIYHYQFRDTVLNILKLVCSTCSNLTLVKDDPFTREGIQRILKMPRNKRLKELIALSGRSNSSYTTCPCTHKNAHGTQMVCTTATKRMGGPKGSVNMSTKQAYTSRRKKNIDDTGTATGTGTTSKKEVTAPRKARCDYEILKMVPEEDLEILGLTIEDVKGMFVSKILVIPTKFRPRTGNNRVNLFTSGVCKIIRVCSGFVNGKEKIGTTVNNLQEFFKQLSEAWIDAFKGKKGLFKGSLHGKLGGTSARGVAVPDGSISHGQVSVSDYYARTALCQEIRVTASNLEACQLLVDNRRVYQVEKGTGPAAGVRHVIKADNFADRSTHMLEVGDKIWRHARTGDPCVMARQPIQNLQNIVGLELVVRPRKEGAIDGDDEEDYAIGVPSTLCPGFNLDFDGDTVMLFVAQTPEARDDIMRKMLLTRNVRSAQRAEPIHGLVYQDILASSLITLPNIEVSESLWSWCISDIESKKIHNTVARLKKAGVPVHSGRGLISAAFPPTFNLKKDGVLIENGVFMEGFLTSSLVTQKSGGIVDRMSIFYSGCGDPVCKCKGGQCKDEGWRITAEYIDDASKILTRFLDSFGFTVGFKDTLLGNVDEKVTDKYFEIFNKIMDLPVNDGYFEKLKYDKDVQGIVNSARSLPTELGVLKWEMQENMDRQEVDLGMGETEELLSERTGIGLRDEAAVGNKILFMSKTVSGVKGDANNLASVSVILGQQRLLGKILSKVLTNGSRMLVTNRPGSFDPAHRGFIKTYYAKGLSPDEVWYGAHSNMEGMASTQSITPDIGVLQKSMDKLMENTISKGGGVLFNGKVVINFAAGGDGLNPSEILTIQGTNQSMDIDTMLGYINNM